MSADADISGGGFVAGVSVRFYAELQDLLPVSLRAREVSVATQRGRAVKDLIESLGVPHTEVDLVLVDGVSVPFDHALVGGERVAVYPVFEAIDIASVTRVRTSPLRESRFIADVHLGRLAALLRMAGFDTVYSNDAGDEDIVLRASSERRIILTRDRGLLKRSAVTHGHLVRSAEAKEQLREVIERFDLAGSLRPFTRCSVCNGVVREVARSEVLECLPEHTARTQEEFSRCDECGRVYWPGSHHRTLSRLMQSVVSEGGSTPGASEQSEGDGGT